MNDRKMVLDGMMGLVVGDALGCPVQFLDREELRERGAVTEMEGYGTYNMPPGTWTDDSSMALATLASINERNCIDLRDIMERFLDWEFHGAYTPFGKAFDEGNTCSNAIYKYRDSHDLTTCGETDEYSNGNGALMRILPVCISSRRKIFRMQMPFGKSIWQQGLRIIICGVISQADCIILSQKPSSQWHPKMPISSPVSNAA